MRWWFKRSRSSELTKMYRQDLMRAMGSKCEECSESDFELLEFHHTHEKLWVWGGTRHYIDLQIWEFHKTGNIPEHVRLLCPTHHKKADIQKRNGDKK